MTIEHQPRLDDGVAQGALLRVIEGSRLVSRLRRHTLALSDAVADSRLLGLVRRCYPAHADLADAVGFWGWLLAVAMMVHLALLEWAEPYPFPGRSAYVLPLLLLLIGLLLVALRQPIAKAWRDRRSR